jgi:hypothetical protein
VLSPLLITVVERTQKPRTRRVGGSPAMENGEKSQGKDRACVPESTFAEICHSFRPLERGYCDLSSLLRSGAGGVGFGFFRSDDLTCLLSPLRVLNLATQVASASLWRSSLSASPCPRRVGRRNHRRARLGRTPPPVSLLLHLI